MEIVELLYHVHDFQVSLSTLKRRLTDNNLKERPLVAVHSSNEEIRQEMQKGLNGSGSRVWYRRVHRELLHKSFVVRKHVVRLFVKDLGSEDVMLRRRRRRRRRRREEIYADVNTVILDLAPHIISMNMRS